MTGGHIRTIFFKTPSPSRSPPKQRHHTFSETLMEENIEEAQSLITKWDPSSNASYCDITSLFRNNQPEAKQYLNSVHELQTALQYFATENPTSEIFVKAQNLMQIAMKRLEREFHQILSLNRHRLDVESVSNRSSRVSARSSVSDMEEESEEELRSVHEVDRVCLVAMDDLKSIADCMISSGYGKECVRAYKIVRKSTVDESLNQLGVERLNFSAVQKMDWEVLELKIKNWLNAVQIAVKTIFNGEKIILDYVFPSSESIRESCFTEISREGAMILFGFPEMVAKCKKSPEKMFRTLDLYEAISNLLPEIESIFSFESTSDVRSEAMTALLKLAEAVRTTLHEFESAVQHNTGKAPLPGGGIHPLARYVMNYIQFLSDYSECLTDILAYWPLTTPSPLPESYFANSESPISVRFAWLILVLLCKIDARAELFHDVSLSYLFLANNLHYVVTKVRSSKLIHHLGDDWVANHEIKVKQYASNFERMSWSAVFSSLPENPTADISPEEAKEHFKKFNTAFQEAYQKQSYWIVPDSKLRDEIKVSIAKKLVPVYQSFYQKNRFRLAAEIGSEVIVRYTPDDLGNYLSDILYGTGDPSFSSASSHSSSAHSSSVHM